jgi:F-type H+-transporting ATPase subunit epsilon
MNEHSLKIVVVTPNGEVFDYETATLVVVTTTAGEVGIMANHSPIIAALAINEVHVVDDDNDYDQIIAVNGGFAEFSNNTLTIIADSAERSDEIDLDRAKSARDRAEARLKKAQEENNNREMVRARASLLRAVNRINAVTGK